MADQPEQLGKYSIVGKLGKGAMGQVYEGHDPVLDRRVAIKVIAESLDADPELVARFRREAKMAAQLNHPNIITIYDFVEEEGNLYIVMELLDGKDLKEIIKSGEALTMEQILGIMEQIADGLSFAHEKGLVHRDLKPANIHITKKGQIKILDFGLVHEASSDMTKTGNIMGTPNYMSPEQVQGLKVDPRSDIFSLGAVFYELLTRKKPFSADSIHATMFKVVQGDREPLAQYTHLPALLVQLVDRSLDANPDGRFRDGNALKDHLRTIRRQILATEGADSTLTGKIDATIVTSPEPGSHPSTPPLSKSLRSRPTTGPSASGSRGTMRRREVTSPSVGATTSSRPLGLYALGGVLVAALAAGAFFFLRNDGGSGPSVEALSEALIASQQELMVRSLEQRDYSAALAQAGEILQRDPQNGEALRTREQAQKALADIDASVEEARAALERGATREAAEALGRVLALDPNHPLGAELRSKLNEHFQSQAESAKREMDQARSAASSAGATARPEFRDAERSRQEATTDFNGGEYTNAAQKFLAARDQYQHARTAHAQAEAARRAQAQKEAAAKAEVRAEARAELDRAQSAWTRLRNRPAAQGVAEHPAYARALKEEASAKTLEAGGDLAEAARAYETAASYLEAARREYEEAEARRRRENARRAAAASSSTPTTVPATSSAPTRAEEEAAIRQTLADYERAIESKNLDLFRQVKPNLTPDEAKRLQKSFGALDSHDVELTIETVIIQGDTASVSVSRRDIIIVRGRSQNGHTRKQTFTLSKSNGNWVVVKIGQ